MIKITYKILPADHLEMLRTVRYTAQRQLMRIAICVVGLGVSFLAYETLGTDWLVLVGFFTVFLGLQIAMPYIVHWHIYRRNTRLFGIRTTTFGEDSLVTDSEIHHVEIKWSSFERFKETRNLFLVVQTKDVAGIVPKRAFADEEELHRFRSLISSKLPASR